MKKFLAFLAIFVLHSTSHAENISEGISPALKFAAAIVTSHDSEDAKTDQLIACHQEHNIYCTAFLGDHYYKNKQYSLAFPLLQQFLQVSPPEPGNLYRWVYFDLGLMYSKGLGVAKNEEKGISNFKKSAKLYETQAAVNVSYYYYTKARNRFFATGNSTDEVMIENLQQAYAWLKLAYKINQKYHDLPNDNLNIDHKSIPIVEFLDEIKMKLAKASPQALAKAEKLVKTLCKNPH